jgi:hypothetical protein
VVALAGTLAVLAGAGPAVAGRPAAVEPRFELATPEGGPFPSDRFTVPDRLQRTGLRVALPLPRCAVERSTCDEVQQLNELDGFDVEPRLSVPFTGPIDVASVTSRTVFLVRLVAGPPEVTALDRLVWDPATSTLHARPEAVLEPETRYGLVVTREVRDARGQPIEPARAFRRLVEGSEGTPAQRHYRGELLLLQRALARRGVPAERVAAASVFTTGSVTTFLEQARDALEARRVPPAVITAPEEGGWAYFPRAVLDRLALRRQVRTRPGTPVTGGEGTFRDQPLPVDALPRDHVAGVGIGWYWSPWYLDADRRIAETPTLAPHRGPRLEVPVPFVIVLPAGPRPPAGWPVALFGHGYGGEMLSSALLVAGTLARHGIATAAISAVGHGGGPESRLLVEFAGGPPRTVRVPGRGVDLDGDGRIDAAEGLAAAAGGPYAALGLRDGLRQQVVDLMALVRALRDGLDVDGDGIPDTERETVGYAGQSLGGIYGTLLLAVDPRVRAAVLNVPGAPVAEIARLSPVFRPLVREALARRLPPLLNGERRFREDLPLRGEAPVTAPAPGALRIQEYLARVLWLQRRGDPLAYARHLRAAPLPGMEPARVLVQLAAGDRVVPNPTTAALVRAGALTDATMLVRYDRIAAVVGPRWAEPHGFLLRTGGPGLVGALARTGQALLARFLLARDGSPWHAEGAIDDTLPEGLVEVPATSLPEGLHHDPEGDAGAG